MWEHEIYCWEGRFEKCVCAWGRIVWQERETEGGGLLFFCCVLCECVSTTTRRFWGGSFVPPVEWCTPMHHQTHPHVLVFKTYFCRVLKNTKTNSVFNFSSGFFFEGVCCTKLLSFFVNRSVWMLVPELNFCSKMVKNISEPSSQIVQSAVVWKGRKYELSFCRCNSTKVSNCSTMTKNKISLIKVF